MATIIEQINQENLKAETPSFNVGDTDKVSFKVIEGTRERIQIFEGTVIAKRAIEKGIKEVVFDRGGFIYQGKIAALADAAREAGLEF